MYMMRPSSAITCIKLGYNIVSSALEYSQNLGRLSDYYGELYEKVYHILTSRRIDDGTERYQNDSVLALIYSEYNIRPK